MTALFSIISTLAALWCLYKQKDDCHTKDTKKALLGMCFFVGLILFVAFAGATFGKLGLSLHPGFAIVVFVLFFAVVAIKSELNETQDSHKTINEQKRNENIY